MSDPVTQAEIEDVLSSIRRLVSEDGRSLSRVVPPVKEVPKPASRLVLTPALRVSAEPAEPVARAKPVADSALSDTPVAAANPAGFTEADHRHGEAYRDQGLTTEGGDIEAPTYTPASNSVCKEQQTARGQDASQIAHEAELRINQAEVFAFSRKDTFADTSLLASESDDALADKAPLSPEPAPESVAAASDHSGDAAPWLQPGATLYEAAIPDELRHAAEGETAVADPIGPDTSLEPDAGFETDPSVETDLPSSQRVSAVVQKIAELEDKVARSQEQWEPDGASSDPYAGTNIETLEWQDHIDDASELAPSAGVEAEADQPESEAEAAQMDSGFAPGIEDAEQLAQDAVADETLEALDGLTGDESYLDEDSLRELVADIVRSELQGPLGERITRNVRKLVRREIQRALAAQDLI